MLLFIKYVTTHTGILKSIQIHLMLLFIAINPKATETSSTFKYISCYYLSKEKHIVMERIIYSNTSHVIIYLDDNPFLPQSYIFKYISCYYLSNKRGCKTKWHLYSNTSHVIIYQEQICMI